MKIAVIPHPEKNKAIILAKKAIEYLKAKSIEAWLVSESALNRTGHPDIVVVFSGDGFLVHRALDLASQEIPVIGIHAGGKGSKGILTMGEAKDWKRVLGQVINRNFVVEKRLMLEALFKEKHYLAVNDVTVKHPEKVAILTLRINKELLYEELLADGVNVATPTGSTAYNQSAGGPIMKHGLKCVAIAPICPVNINVKPIVCDEKDEVEIVYLGTKGKSLEGVRFTVDGKTKARLKPHDKIEIRAAKNCTYFAVLEGYSYYEALQRIGLSR